MRKATVSSGRRTKRAPTKENKGDEVDTREKEGAQGKPNKRAGDLDALRDDIDGIKKDFRSLQIAYIRTVLELKKLKDELFFLQKQIQENMNERKG